MPARAETLTVYNGTTTSQYVPAYVYYWDDFTRSECVIPASALGDMTGGTISAIKFYTTSDNIPYTSAAAAYVYLKEVNYSSISSYETRANSTVVYQGTLNFVSADGGGEVTINLTTPFTYNGGNLLIGTENVSDAGYKNIKFYGQTVNGASIAGANDNSAASAPASKRDFIPKTTFTYTPSAGQVYYAPKNLTVSNIGANEATVSWTPGSTETSWNVEYKKASEASWTSAGAVSSPTIMLDALENGTNYEVRVQADYGSGNLSNWATTSFATTFCDPASMGEITYDIYDAWGDGWNGNVSLQIVNHSSGAVVQVFTVLSASGKDHITGTLKLCYGVDYDLVWVGSNNYTYECGFTITDPDGNVIYEHAGSTSSSGGTTITAGTLTTFQINIIPTNLTVSDITARSANASWTGSDDAKSYNLRYRKAAYTEISFFDDFENGLGNWTIYTDGEAPQANGWTITANGTLENVNAHSGTNVASAWSWSTNAYNANNWLITPQVTFVNSLKFWVRTAGQWPDSYEVLLSTTGNAESNFTVTLQAMATAPTNDQWNEVAIDLSAYKGQTGYIAIHHVSEDCNYLLIDDFGIYGDDIDAGEWITISPATSPQELSGLDPETEYEVQVQAVNADDTSNWTNSVNFTTLPASAMPTDLAVANITARTAVASWNGAQDSYNLRYRKLELASDFEDSSLGGWTTIDADGDGYNWILGSAVGGVYLGEGASMAGTGHSPQDLIVSGSFSNVTGVGALTPDNYLVSPKVKLGGSISFWAKGQDATYYAEKFGVAVSTTGNTNAADFTMVGQAQIATADWVQYEFDLSAYAGQEGYVAIRHYDISDVFILDVDDIAISSPGSNWETIANVTSPNTIEGLYPESLYEVQVQGNLDEGTTSWTSSVYFTTPEQQAVEATLAEICENGEQSYLYTISDQLVAVAYAENDEGSFLWCKDQGNASIFSTAIHEGEQLDFMVEDGAQTGAWDQSNWIALKFTDLTTTEAATIRGYVNSYIDAGAITGVLVDDSNFMLAVEGKTLATTSGASYTKNVYCTSNFVVDNLNLFGSVAAGDGGYTTGNQEQNYFFMNPKVQEACTITYAMWDAENECFTVPSNSGFEGRVSVDLAYNENPSLDLSQALTDKKVYQFEAIVNRSSKDAYGLKAARAGEFKVYPTNLTGGDDNNPPTAISTVGIDGVVKSVKYVNVAGMVSDKPFQGVNIVVTTRGDGTTTAAKKVF